MSNNKVTIKGLDSAYQEPLNCILNSSFSIQIEKNTNWQLSLTAYDDKSVAFNLLAVEASLFWDNQEYIIKQVEIDNSEGITTCQVTATHVAYEIYKIFNRNTKTATLSVKDVLSFYLDNNDYGFTYEVQGVFDTKSFTDLGSNNAKDMLSTIFDAWEDAIFYPDNKNIRIYQHDSIAQNLGNRIDYLRDTSEVQLTYDSSSGIVNKLRCVSEAEDDEGTVYFDPFYVQDDDSINLYGIHDGGDLSDDRFHSASSMKNYALTQLTPEPSLSIEVTKTGENDFDIFEIVRLEVRKSNFVVNVEVVSVQYYPFDITQSSSVTLNSNATNILNYQKKAKNNLQNNINSQKTQITSLTETITKQQETITSVNANYTSLSKQYLELYNKIQNIIDNNDVWVSGSIFIDTSSNNSLTQAQFNNMYSDGAKGLIVKLTEGTTYTNSTAPTHISYAKSAGMSIVGAYHFLRGTSTGTAQGQAFLAQLKAQSIGTNAIVACDIESSDLSTNLATLNSMISDFYAVLTAAGYTNTADYASASWFGSRFTSTAKFKWIASWSASTAPTGASAWQFTDSWESYGVDASYSYAKAFI